MNWILASLLMMISSVALYISVRKSIALQTPRELNNLAMFLIPVLLYLLLTLSTPTNFILKPIEYLIIVIQAIFFSYLGNVFSLKGIENAPNPGYSLIISKSYVVFTAIASIFLFSAPFTIQTAMAIFCIISFSALIMIDSDKKKSDVNSSWLPYTMGAFFCWGFLALSSKYLLNQGVPILSRLVISMTISSLFILTELVVRKIPLRTVSKTQGLTLLSIGLFGSCFAYCMQLAFDLAPNVGFVNAANAGSIGLLTLMSALIFKDELTTKKMIGVVGVSAGLLLLFI